MKEFNKMDLNEKVAWATGEICLAIGKGNVQSAVSNIILVTMTDAYQRGQDAIDHQRKKKKKK